MWEDRIGGMHSDHSSIEIYLSRAGQPAASRLAVFVDDADAAQETYRTEGAEIVDELKTQPWGLRGRRVFMRMPPGPEFRPRTGGLAFGRAASGGGTGARGGHWAADTPVLGSSP